MTHGVIENVSNINVKYPALTTAVPGLSILTLSGSAGSGQGARKEPKAESRSAGRIILTGKRAAPKEPLSLWCRQPAANCQQALPVGNGRLGCRIYAGVATERLTLNEDTVWRGAPVPYLADPGLAARWPGVRQWLVDGKYAEAGKLLWQTLAPHLATTSTMTHENS